MKLKLPSQKVFSMAEFLKHNGLEKELHNSHVTRLIHARLVQLGYSKRRLLVNDLNKRTWVYEKLPVELSELSKALNEME